MSNENRLETIGSFVICIEHYVQRLNDEVFSHNITGNEILLATGYIYELLEIVSRLCQENYDEKELIDGFYAIESKLDKII